MFRSGQMIRCAVAVLLMAPPACGEDRLGEPAAAASFDAVGTRSALEAMDRVFRIGPWASFRGLGARFGVSAPRNAATGGIAAVPRLPFELRGQTFVFDPTLQRYLPDLSRAGAPPNGVRYVLYAVDSLTGLPAVEREIGYAEITDEGDALPSGVALRLRVVAGGMTHLDYRVRADGTPTSGSLAATGFAADSATHLGFDIGVAAVGAPGVGPESLPVRFAFAIPERGFSATGATRNTRGDSGSVGELGLVVRVGPDLIEVSVRGDSTAMDATFKVNGRLFASVFGDPRSPTIRAEGGRQLSGDEMLALQGIATMAGSVFGIVQSLLQPAGALLGLGMP